MCNRRQLFEENGSISAFLGQNGQLAGPIKMSRDLSAPGSEERGFAQVHESEAIFVACNAERKVAP